MKVYFLQTFNVVLSTSFYVVNVSVSNFKVYLAPKIIFLSDWGIVYSNKLVFFIHGCILQLVVSRSVPHPPLFFSSPLVEIEERFCDSGL